VSGHDILGFLGRRFNPTDSSSKTDRGITLLRAKALEPECQSTESGSATPSHCCTVVPAASSRFTRQTCHQLVVSECAALILIYREIHSGRQLRMHRFGVMPSVQQREALGANYK
jgi:hypothetical protein